jgi:hypothetical protein
LITRAVGQTHGRTSIHRPSAFVHPQPPCRPTFFVFLFSLISHHDNSYSRSWWLAWWWRFY